MSSVTPIDLAGYRALAQLRYHLRRFLRNSEEAARQRGLHSQQYQVLLALKGMPESVEPNIAALAERLQLRHHSAVELVDRMEQRNLLRRERGRADRRRVVVQLTTEGEEILSELVRFHDEELRCRFPELVQELLSLRERGAS